MEARVAPGCLAWCWINIRKGQVSYASPSDTRDVTVCGPTKATPPHLQLRDIGVVLQTNFANVVLLTSRTLLFPLV